MASELLPSCELSFSCGCQSRIASLADLDKKQIIATATLVVELKFIRGCGKCGHIEDVVVDSSYRGLRLGLRVIEALLSAAQVRH
jgi:glucosamine-phosphate N-acetyltransferase